MLSFINGVVLTSILIYIFRSRPIPKQEIREETTVSGTWVLLKSGSFKHYGNGSIGYIMQSSAGNAYWWIVRNGKTIIEGPSDSIDSAALESDSMAKELIS